MKTTLKHLILELLSGVNFNWTGIVKYIEVTTIGKKFISIEGTHVNWSFIPQFPACQSIDLNDYVDFKGDVPSYIEFYFNKIPNLGVELKSEDNRKALSRRTLESNFFDFEGISMEIKNLDAGDFYEFTLKLFETITPNLKSRTRCKNYPTEKYFHYSDCDMDFVYNEMKNKYKIMPFWAARTLDEVTRLK